MSQYPPPYTPPPYGFSPAPVPYLRYDPAAALAPARRASLAMWVFGGLCLFGGLAMIGMSRVVTTQMIATSPQGAQLQKLQEQSGLPLQTLCLIDGIFVLVPGVVMVGLAFWVRRGGRTAAVLSATVTALLLGFIGISVVAGPDLTSSLCVAPVPLVLLGLSLKWLVQAAKAAPHVAALREQMRVRYDAPPAVPGPPPNFAQGFTQQGYPGPAPQLPPQASQAPQAPPGYGQPGTGGYGAGWPGTSAQSWQGWRGPPGQTPFSFGAPTSATYGPALTGGGYGYAQAPAPPIPQPPPGDAPVVPVALGPTPAPGLAPAAAPESQKPGTYAGEAPGSADAISGSSAAPPGTPESRSSENPGDDSPTR